MGDLRPPEDASAPGRRGWSDTGLSPGLSRRVAFVNRTLFTELGLASQQDPSLRQPRSPREHSPAPSAKYGQKV